MVYKDTIYKRVSEDTINATVNVCDDIKRFFATEVALVINFPLGLTVIGCLKKGKVCFRAKWPIRPELIPVSHVSMKRLEVFLLPPGWDASPSQGYPQH